MNFRISWLKDDSDFQAKEYEIYAWSALEAMKYFHKEYPKAIILKCEPISM